MPGAGLEPARLAAQASKTCAAASYATPALNCLATERRMLVLQAKQIKGLILDCLANEIRLYTLNSGEPAGLCQLMDGFCHVRKVSLQKIEEAACQWGGLFKCRVMFYRTTEYLQQCIEASGELLDEIAFGV